MKKKVLVIIGCFLVLVSLILVFIYRCHFNGTFSDKSNDWANFVTYFTGFLTPLISVIGFYLVIITIESSDKSNRTNNFIKSIDNIENQIGYILSKKVFIQIGNATDVLEEDIHSLLMITNKYPIKISDSKDMKHLNNQVQEVFNLRQLLIILSKLINKTVNIDNKNKEWSVIYKYKYSIICKYISKSDTLFIASLLKRLEDEYEQDFKLTEKDRELLKYYEVTALDIHKEEF